MISKATENPLSQNAPRAAWHPRFRSFRAKLMVLVALAVSVPALLTCLILGVQLDRQARTLFANELAANLETFSLLLSDAERNLFDGLKRTAADNTLQITLDLEMSSQLARYIEAQRQVLGITFIGVFDRNSRNIAFSGSGRDQDGATWRLGAIGEDAGDCVAARYADQQIVNCKGTVYLISVAVVFRTQDSALGDGAGTSQASGLLGYLLGGTPLASPALIGALQSRQIAHPLIWIDEKLVYFNIEAGNLPPPSPPHGVAKEYILGQSAYLGATRATAIGARNLVYGVMSPLAPLRSALLGSVLTVAGIGVLLVTGTMIALSFIANRLLLPVQQLREGAARIGSGDLSQRISIKTSDELETLADQFNDMADRLQESHASLERKVATRTHELAQSVNELRALGDVSRAINSTLDLETVLTTIVAQAVQLSGTDAGAIYVFDERRQEFRLRATYGMEAALIAAITNEHIQIGKSAIGEAAAKRMPVQIADVRDAPDAHVLDVVVKAGFRAVLVIPLLGADEVVGALVVRRKDPGEFAKNSVDLLQTFAAQSVVAIKNARLFSEIDEKSRQLELASQHKSQFLANMSHELRTPLNAILGYTELILDNIYGETPEKVRTVLARVQSNGTHLLGLINDVLDLSKIEAGQLKLSLTDYSLKDVVHGVLAGVEPLASEKKLALTVQMPPDLPPGHGDERRLTQVLLNLVGNAIKFTDTGEVSIKASASDSEFIVAVRDTGPGIAVEDQQKIFDEFQQADGSATKTKGGTGLGLSIAKHIIEMHGGRLWVESDLGRGSTFSFTIPVLAEQRVAHS